MAGQPAEPLDASSHESYLGAISSTLEDILKELKKLRNDVQELNRTMSHH